MCNGRMEDDDIRRHVLRALIKARFNDTPNQYAIAVKKPPGQINDMMSNPPRKAFGARIARSMEIELGLDRLFFEDINNAKSLSEYSKTTSVRDIQANQTLGGYADLNEDERILLAGFRAAGPERRDDMLNLAAAALKTDGKAA